MQGCGAGETGFSQIPREQPEAWGEVFEAADTRLGTAGDERKGERPAVRMEGPRGGAIGAVAEEADVVAVGEELLVDVVGKVGALVDDHADGGGRQPGGGSALRGRGWVHGPDACADGGICARAADLAYGVWGVKVVDDEEADGDKERHRSWSDSDSHDAGLDDHLRQDRLSRLRTPSATFPSSALTLPLHSSTTPPSPSSINPPAQR